MVSPFETVILKMRETGMFQFLLPYMLSSAIFYGLLRKSQIFGDPKETVSINAVVALVASFMVWSAPILLGIDIETRLASFFVHGISATLIVIVGLMIIGMISPPDLPKHFAKVFEQKPNFWIVVLVAGLLVGGVVAVSSGLVTLYFPGSAGGGGFFSLDEDIVMSLGIVLILVITLVLITALG